ncbi:MAG: hypothetical protein LBM75_07240 [Myxococcales bacterium]|nr:hypothetical protein [Myxococcales bacterium]
MNVIKKFVNDHPVLVSLVGTFALIGLYHSGKLNAVFSKAGQMVLPPASPTPGDGSGTTPTA